MARGSVQEGECIMMNRGKRHTPKQVGRKLGQADGLLADGGAVAAVCSGLQVSEQTYYLWRNQYGGLKAWATSHPSTALGPAPIESNRDCPEFG